MRILLFLFLILAPICDLKAQIPAPIMGGQAAASTGSTGTVVISRNASCGASSTCVVTLTGPIGAGDLVLVKTDTQDVPIRITGTDNGTSCNSLSVWQAAYFNGGSSVGGSYDTCAIIGAAAEATSITVSISAGSGGYLAATIIDVPVSGGTISLDAVNSLGFAVSPTSVGSTLALSGTNCFVVAGLGNGASSVTGTWAATDVSSYPEFAYIGALSSLGTYTWSGTNLVSKDAESFCFGPAPSVTSQITDGSGGTSGMAPTGAILNAATTGMLEQGPTGYGATWYESGTNNFTYTASALASTIHSPYRYLNGGATYPDSATLGLSMPTGDGNNCASDCLVFAFPGGGTSAPFVSTTVTVCVAFQTSLPSNTASTNMDFIVMGGGSGGSGSHYVTLRVLPTGSALTIGVEMQTGGTGTVGTISPNTWYYGCVQSNTGTGQFDVVALYSATGSLIGSYTGNAATTGLTKPTSLSIGNVGANNIPSGSTLFIDKINIGWSIGGTSYALPLIQ
jgi:hypothetical protein